MKTNKNKPAVQQIKKTPVVSSKSPVHHTNSVYSPSKYNPFITHKKTSPLASSRRTKTAAEQEIRQLAQKHYNQAMKYVYKKNQQNDKAKERQINKNKPQKQPLTSEHTFVPNISTNRYSKRLQQMKIKTKKDAQLRKWEANNSSMIRQKIIEKQVATMRRSLSKEYRSLQNSRSPSFLKSSLEKSFQSSIKISQKPSRAQMIPGVRKFYLNQTKAQIAKQRNQKLLFKGNQITGYYF